jgi:4-hydroxybenzoate polyprenyltransferase
MLDWLRLIRASGLFTIASNTMAAILVCAAGEDLRPLWLLKRLQTNGWEIFWVPVASFCLYASGMLWNDLNDIDRDRVLNPRRPLPSGRVGLATAYVVGVLLSIGALAAGYMAEGRTGFYAAGVVLTLAMLYDFAAKDVPYVGSLMMGLVRASHAVFVLLLLGQDYFKMALLVSHSPGSKSMLLCYPLILGLYIFGLTLVSELESRKAHRWELLVGGSVVLLAIALAVVRVATAPWILPLERWGAAGPVAVTLALAVPVVILGWLLVLVGRPYLQALSSGRQALVGATVFAGLAGIILLDALVAASAHPVGAVLVACLFPLFRGVGAMIRMD